MDFAGGDGSPESPFLIRNWYHLDNVRDYLDEHGAAEPNEYNFKLMCTLDENTEGYDDVVPMDMLGTFQFSSPNNIPDLQLTGEFDGNYFEIKNLKLNTYDEIEDTYYSLFSAYDTIKNLTLVFDDKADADEISTLGHSGDLAQNVTITGALDIDCLYYSTFKNTTEVTDCAVTLELACDNPGTVNVTASDCGTCKHILSVPTIGEGIGDVYYDDCAELIDCIGIELDFPLQTNSSVTGRTVILSIHELVQIDTYTETIEDLPDLDEPWSIEEYENHLYETWYMHDTYMVPEIRRPTYGGGTGTEQDPYIISNWFHLHNIRKNTVDYFELDQDINIHTEGYKEMHIKSNFRGQPGDTIYYPGDVSTDSNGTHPIICVEEYAGEPYTIGTNPWVRVETEHDIYYGFIPQNINFMGELDGKGHTISGFEVRYFGGLFSLLRAIVDDLTLIGDVQNDAGAGLLAGNLEGHGCEISNVIGKGTVKGTIAGGLFGSFTDDSIDVHNCEFDGNVYGDTAAGGIIGSVTVAIPMTIDQCKTSGYIQAPVAGGVAGVCSDSITQCTSDATINSVVGGGIVGALHTTETSPTTSECYSKCTFKGMWGQGVEVSDIQIDNPVTGGIAGMMTDDVEVHTSYSDCTSDVTHGEICGLSVIEMNGNSIEQHPLIIGCIYKHDPIGTYKIFEEVGGR